MVRRLCLFLATGLSCLILHPGTTVADSPGCCFEAVPCGNAISCGSGCGAEGNQASPCSTSHKGLFYNNDFSYLNDCCYQGSCLGDCLKLMPVAGGDFGTLDIGGQLRMRYHHERGMGQSDGLGRFNPTETDFALTRLRLYSNWEVNDRLRVYAEGILADASDDGGNYTPRGIDRNYGDFLNLFADLKLTDGMSVRIGRQELLYGNQRTISPLDWANTRRTFEGVKVMTKAGDWSLDGFYTHLVTVIPNKLDEADYNQSVYGYYLTYGGFENFSVETYYIGYDNENAGPITGDFSLHTLGVRVNGGIDDWLFELEGGPQFGRQSGLGLDQEAMFATVGIGYKLGSTMPWSPTVWCYYDYASGNNVGGDFNRFNQLFPLAHKYLGFIDAVQRSNIEAPNVLLTMQPAKKLSLLFWYWHFMANQDTDIVPAIGGTPPQSTSSKDFGDELDVIAKYQIGSRSNVLFGWSHFWRGNKILAPNDADFFYTQWEMNF
ncbi:alginate export family protein [Adhaeretor mobilis]|uniref:Alginate export domain-containing protein n=1 Tax=Adhaeretor mobilis TaxID=1930276 RepID=A0A517MV74_9BACT|nr:alginate export family protein [Adhaeretor mobilis]QDS98780.1 hypothetical protein HG15A2_20650 [Adhaeretor mobilis]